MRDADNDNIFYAEEPMEPGVPPLHLPYKEETEDKTQGFIHTTFLVFFALFLTLVLTGLVVSLTGG